MYKRKGLVLFCLISMLVLQAHFAYGYTIMSVPRNSNITWYPHSSLGFAHWNAASYASGTWNSAPGNFSFTEGSLNSGNYNIGDSRSDVAVVDFADIDELDNGWAGACYRFDNQGGNGRHVGFDIVFNSNTSIPWGSGRGDFADRAGVATHEFGHAVGLGDLYAFYNPVPTLYWSSHYLGVNITYDFRTLENDDKNGKSAIANQI